MRSLQTQILPSALSTPPGICLIGLILLFAGACRSPHEKVQSRVNVLRQEWLTNVVQQANLPEQILDWPTALDLLHSGNPKLRQVGFDLTNSIESVRQVWRDLLPSLNLRSGISRSMRNIGSTGPDDVTFSADSFLNVPGMVNFSARLYAARLFQYRSEASFDLMEREQTIALYKLFLVAQEAEAQHQRFERQKITARAMQEIDPFTGRLMATATELQELDASKELHTIQDQAAELFGNRNFRWRFTTNGLPALSYDREPLPLSDTNSVAQLQMRLVAIEYEAARAQLLGIKLRYWPDLNLFVTGPPIYQRGAGRSVFWDAAEVRASADLFWNIDTKGYITRQLRQTKRSQFMQREAYRLQAKALVDRLIFTQSLLQASLEKESQLEQQLRVLIAIPPVQSLPALEKYAEDYRGLQDNQRKLRRELAELKTLFWFVDDRAWAHQKTTLKVAAVPGMQLASANPE